ncbi:hypothetical protein ACC862_37415, partial [Rhizobium ruizarguesonis]
MTVSVVAAAKPAAITSVARDVVWLLWQDKVAFGAAILLLFVLLFTILGPWLLADQARAVNLLARNAIPYQERKVWR